MNAIPLTASPLRKSSWLAGLITCLGLLLAPAIAPAPSHAARCANGATGGLTSGVKCKPIRKARLVNGRAVAPTHAPKRVKRVINWANKIRNKPYLWGGGHGRWHDRGYDCSGAVSFALRGGNFLKRPFASPGLMNWKKRGKGRWLTVYSNHNHAYLVVAGLRFDTSMTPGNGPAWSRSLRSTPGRFVARHPARF